MPSRASAAFARLSSSPPLRASSRRDDPSPRACEARIESYCPVFGRNVLYRFRILEQATTPALQFASPGRQQFSVEILQDRNRPRTRGWHADCFVETPDSTQTTENEYVAQP